MPLSPLASWFFLISIVGSVTYLMLTLVLEYAAKHEFDSEDQK